MRLASYLEEVHSTSGGTSGAKASLYETFVSPDKNQLEKDCLASKLLLDDRRDTADHEGTVRYAIAVHIYNKERISGFVKGAEGPWKGRRNLRNFSRADMENTVDTTKCFSLTTIQANELQFLFYFNWINFIFSQHLYWRQWRKRNSL